MAKEIYAKFKKEMQLRGAYFLSSVEAQKVRKTIIVNGALNAKIVGQSAHTIAALSGFEVPEDAKVLVGEVTSVEPSEEFSHEKLSPVLAMYKAESFEDALDKADRLVREGGPGHTSAIYIDERTQGDRLRGSGKGCRPTACWSTRLRRREGSETSTISAFRLR